MGQRMLKVLLAVGLAAVLVLGGRSLYRHFVTDRITDRDGMTNPFHQQDPEEPDTPEEEPPDTNQ